MSESLLFPILLILGLFVLSALFSGCETGIISLNLFQLTAKARKGSKNAQVLLKLMKNQEGLLTGLLVGNNLVNISCSAIGASLGRFLLGRYGPPVSTVVMTLGLLIFGEILPKIFFYQNAMQASLILAPFLRIVRFVFLPLSHFVKTMSIWLGHFFSSSTEIKRSYMTRDELRFLISPDEQFVRMPLYEKEMIYRTLEY